MTVEIRTGDCREVLRQMPDESVHCVVTSPPYFGLRDYGTAKWEGGDAGCDHFKLAGGTGAQGLGKSAEASQANVERSSVAYRDTCGKCGAVRIDSQLGLEPSPAEYIEGMVGVFREVRRVLRKDGTLWLNIGDSYAGSWGAQGRQGKDGQMADRSVVSARQIEAHPKRASRTGSVAHLDGVKPKDLIGIPWMLAFALRADGWWLRQDIIWAKPNPMPESVTDRCTKAHEYLFLLTKSAKYYYDAEAIAEDSVKAGLLRPFNTAKKSARTVDGRPGTGNEAPGAPPVIVGPERNKRSVWTVTTQPFAEAHFATFPPALIEPCILAGCPSGGTVLDPFGGAGTTGLVADRHHRNAILVELNPDYAAMAKRRIEGESPLFAQVVA